MRDADCAEHSPQAARGHEDTVAPVMVGRTEAATPLSRVERDAQHAPRPPRRVPTQRLDAEAGRQRVGQPTGQHPSGCPVDDRDQSPGWAAKSKCMRDRNLGMSGSRETRVAPGSIGVRSRLPAGASGIRTLVPARTRDPTLSKLMFPGDTEPEKSEIEPGVCGALRLSPRAFFIAKALNHRPGTRSNSRLLVSRLGILHTQSEDSGG